MEKEYKGTPGVTKLVTKETPLQILSEDYPLHQWPISGGWGYTKDDAVVIELDNSNDGVAFEYKFMQYRSFEEGIVFMPKGQRLAGFNFETKMQCLLSGKDGRHYDRIVMEVTVFREEDFDFLKNDWESHNGYEDDLEGKMEHLLLAESKRIRYEIEGYFDITRFFGK